MGRVNRPAIGTIHCEHCDGTRSVHQYESGKHKGKLYTRCPSCDISANKFISKLGSVEQTFLRSKASFKPEFAELAINTEPQNTPKPLEKSGVQEIAAPQNTPNNEPQPEPTRTPKGRGVKVAVVSGLGFLLIAIGAMSL